MDWTPIRKVLAGFLGAGITYAALRLGVDLGSQDINEAASAIVGLGLAYLVPDPQVV